VARLHTDFRATGTHIKGPTLEAVRQVMQNITPYVLSRIPRGAHDDPAILECWL
jgi:hypothetical protein